MSRTLNPELFGPNQAPIVKVDGAVLQSRKVGELESQIEVVNQKLDRWAQIMEQKLQQLQANQKHLVDQSRQMAEHFSQQMANMSSKLNERKMLDGKTQEMIDRHNQLVNVFETRFQHLQKVTTEQEIKLMTYHATYDEVLREIRSIKR